MKLYIVHGWTYTLDKWQAVAQALEQRGFEPVLLKVPGLTAPSDEVWNIDAYIQWLAGELKGETSPVVIGHSNGGRIALKYLQTYPGSFKRLILIDSAGVPHPTLWPKTKLKLLKIISVIGKPLKGIPGVRKVFYKVIKAHDYEQAPPNMQKTMQHMLMADNTIDPSVINVPTTIIWGRNDGITPLKDGRWLARTIGGSELRIIDGARHSPMATHPEEVADIIANALKETA